MDETCLFCKIGTHEIPSKKVYEDSYAVAFLDIHPVADGHVVVIPKTHAKDIITLPDVEIAHLFTAVKKTTILLKEKLGVCDFTIGINHGSVAGQLVSHIHVHVIPRSSGDGGGSIHSVIKKENQKESVEIIYDKIIA